jgi:F-type H+-transporting ATPase subunit gamma
MPSIKDLRKRITSVKNTQQTTKAMKMVSAAKLRRAQEAITNHRPYARRIGELIRLVSSLPSAGPSGESPLVRREHEEGVAKRVLVVLVTSDRGLCGAFNSNVIKTGARWVAANASSYGTIKLGFVGRKGYDYFKSRKVEMGPYWQDLGGKVTFEKAKKLADAVVELYLNDGVDEVKFIYNEFKNAVTQKVLVEDFLPLANTQTEEGELKAAQSGESNVFIVKPSQEAVLEMLLKKNFAIQTFRIMLESQAGEHGARMSSMDNATRNAGEMIRKLTLQYNKQRQAGITKELLEIISGSESQKG